MTRTNGKHLSLLFYYAVLIKKKKKKKKVAELEFIKNSERDVF